ncbi:MAG: hypothetical protein JRH18_01455 [Deltaproteobacteria bacterium]|nr:hypothetical protein [Deltaproteobacteria bacterium]MBW1960273.1 hypothetical protein [Deltaproteobacteria bacterium]MBW1993626.1 hypothetical protein [Deltaproteobacteria bacterium]MBW2150314.1 hypothetical protein [Deltaproteobacteria bacterium]
MSLRRVLVLVVIAGLIIGCAGSAKNLNKVRLGMTKVEVIKAMGKPAYVSARENVEFLNYKLRSKSIFTDEYFVRLKDGRVDLFGRKGDFGFVY